MARELKFDSPSFTRRLGGMLGVDVIISVAAKQKAWLCLCGSLGACMLLFMMVSMITPLGSTALHVVLCLAGGALFAVGLGVFSNKILNKTSLV